MNDGEIVEPLLTMGHKTQPTLEVANMGNLACTKNLGACDQPPALRRQLHYLATDILQQGKMPHYPHLHGTNTLLLMQTKRSLGESER